MRSRRTAGSSVGEHDAEQHGQNGGGRPATPAADLWSLGVTLYTAVTGRSPFHREDTQATLAAILHSRPTPPAHAGRLWPVIKGLLDKDPARRLTAAQARPLLAAVAAADVASSGGARRSGWWPGAARRCSILDDTGRTLAAPPPTAAAPTVDQDPLGDTVPSPPRAEPGTVTAEAAPRTGVRRSRRLWTAGLAAALLIVAGALALVRSEFGDDRANGRSAAGSAPVPALQAGGPAGQVASASHSASPPVNPSLDACLVGSWRSTSVQVVNHMYGVDSRFSGGAGTTMTIRPDGKVVTDYNRSAPLTATIKGARYVEVLRGAETSRVQTRGARLTIYGNKNASTDSYQRVSRTP